MKRTLGPQGLPSRTDEEVPRGVVGELALAEEAHAPAGLVQRPVGADARVLHGLYVFRRPVGPIGGYVVWPHLPTEGGPKEQVEHGAVLGDLARGDQHGEDDACLATVHDVVGPVAEPAGVFGPPHGAGVGVGPAGSGVGGPLAPGGSLERAVLGA